MEQSPSTVERPPLLLDLPRSAMTHGWKEEPPYRRPEHFVMHNRTIEPPRTNHAIDLNGSLIIKPRCPFWLPFHIIDMTRSFSLVDQRTISCLPAMDVHHHRITSHHHQSHVRCSMGGRWFNVQRVEKSPAKVSILSLTQFFDLEISCPMNQKRWLGTTNNHRNNSRRIRPHTETKVGLSPFQRGCNPAIHCRHQRRRIHQIQPPPMTPFSEHRHIWPNKVGTRINDAHRPTDNRHSRKLDSGTDIESNAIPSSQAAIGRARMIPYFHRTPKRNNIP